MLRPLTEKKHDVVHRIGLLLCWLFFSIIFLFSDFLWLIKLHLIEFGLLLWPDVHAKRIDVLEWKPLSGTLIAIDSFLDHFGLQSFDFTLFVGAAFGHFHGKTDHAVPFNWLSVHLYLLAIHYCKKLTHLVLLSWLNHTPFVLIFVLKIIKICNGAIRFFISALRVI